VWSSLIIISQPLCVAVLELTDDGYPGITCMKRLCREANWQPRIDWDIGTSILDCTVCIVSGRSARPVRGFFLPVPPPSGGNDSLDSAKVLMAAPAHQPYQLVAMEVMLCDLATSTAVIDILTILLYRFWLVEEAITDHEVQFTSPEFAEF
jgi:hypothetical protein